MNMLDRIVKRLFKNNQHKEYQFRFNNNFLVEFIGPAGIGKTTLYNKVHAIANFLHHSNEVINNNVYSLNTPQHSLLLQNKLQFLFKTAYNTYTVAELINYFTSVILKDITLQFKPTQQGVILEEGICHNFSRELQELSINDLNKILHNRVLIYLRPTQPYTVVERIRKRQKQGGHTVSHHQGKTDDELLKITENAIVNYDSLVQLVKQFNLPTLIISDNDNNAPLTIVQFLQDNIIVTQQ